MPNQPTNGWLKLVLVALVCMQIFAHVGGSDATPGGDLEAIAIESEVSGRRVDLLVAKAQRDCAAKMRSGSIDGDAEAFAFLQSAIADAHATAEAEVDRLVAEAVAEHELPLILEAAARGRERAGKP